LKDLLIVDGHNYIFYFYRTGKLKNKDIENLKDRLISDLSTYRSQKECSVTVVFDAKGGSNRIRGAQTIDGIEVIYSREGETADTVIEELAKKWSEQRRVFIVTSDYLQQKVVLGNNTVRKSCREFGLEINSVKENIRQAIKENRSRSGGSFIPLENRLDPNAKKKISDLRKNN
jgi:uncharacterized protein